MTTAQEIKSISTVRLSAPTAKSLALVPYFSASVVPFPPDAEHGHTQSRCCSTSCSPYSCLTGPVWTVFSFPTSCSCTLSQNLMLRRETMTKYKSSFLSLCHPDSLSTLLHLFSLFSPPSQRSLLPHTLPRPLLTCSPPYTNTSLINCGTGNYTEPTGKFHFHLHLDCGIFHSYQSAAPDQRTRGSGLNADTIVYGFFFLRFFFTFLLTDAHVNKRDKKAHMLTLAWDSAHTSR